MIREEALKIAKPILFNTEMVRAILYGRKTQTRIVVKLPVEILKNGYSADDVSDVSIKNNIAYFKLGWLGRGGGFAVNPQYKKGDILYVRETFHANNTGELITYRADFDLDAFSEECYYEDCSMVGEKWKPSVRMPKKYARIFLKVTNVRVERLQDIGNNDAIQDGFDYEDTEIGFPNGWAGATQTPRFSFAIDWNDEAKDGFRWEDNPYVFVYEFDMVEA